jgi:adhesin transport system membrane fusion protein
LQETSVALEDRVTRTAVRSPVNGTVKQVKINTLGGVIQPGMELMEIVPLDDSLLVEAKVGPKDIAFLHPGQKAIVKLTAYDFAIYGALTGKVEHISADTIKDEHEQESYYLVRVRTDKTDLGTQEKALPIIPGMQAEVDILTGKKSVIEYLFKPLLRAKGRALRER